VSGGGDDNADGDDNVRAGDVNAPAETSSSSTPPPGISLQLPPGVAASRYTYCNHSKTRNSEPL